MAPKTTSDPLIGSSDGASVTTVLFKANLIRVESLTRVALNEGLAIVDFFLVH